MGEQDHTHQALAHLQSVAQFIRSYVQPLLPHGWTVCHGPEVHRSPTEPNMAIVGVGAELDDRALPYVLHAGFKLTVPLDFKADAQKVGAELGDHLRRVCEQRSHERSRLTEVRFTLQPGAIEPKRGTPGCSGYDLHALDGYYLQPGRTHVFHSGVSIELPVGYEAQVRPRSSMSRRGLLVHLGTVDQDYRGIIGATVTNLSTDAQRIDPDDRVAQLVIARVEHMPWVLVGEGQLSETKRGTGGFGSTGR